MAKVVTVTCWVQGWSAELDVSSTHEAERHLKVSAKLYDRDQYKFGGAEVEAAHGYIRSKLLPQDTTHFTKPWALSPIARMTCHPARLCALPHTRLRTEASTLPAKAKALPMCAWQC